MPLTPSRVEGASSKKMIAHIGRVFKEIEIE
jgi:hypothetical protein